MQIADDLIEYFKRELVYLREQGADFSQRYPKVAARLRLDGGESPDPQTEHLIESVAFIGARVHRALDREFPQITAALLDSLCPSLTQPVPSMSVAQFGLDLTQGKVTSGLRVPKHTVLQVRTPGGDLCRMRTAWDTTLWPIRPSQVQIDDGRLLRLSFECLDGSSLEELEVDRLRLHLQGDWMRTMPLYDLLASGVASLHLVGGDGRHHALPRSAWREVGFDDGEAVLPNPPQAQAAYGLLQEYFAFPRKFHFFEISGLAGRLGRGSRFELCLTLNRPVSALRGLDASNLALGCVPVVNLFPRTSEPVVVDGRRPEYLLVADRQHELSTEVHSVLSVTASDPDVQRAVQVPAFTALTPQQAADGRTAFWWGRRDACLRADLSGSDLWLSFVDSAMGPALVGPAALGQSGARQAVMAEPVVYAQLLCTNRGLAAQIPAGARMAAEGLSSGLTVRCLYQPSPQRAAAVAADTLWRLVSLLRLNHQSLLGASADPVDDEGGAHRTDSAAALRHMLGLMAGGDDGDAAQLRGLRSLVAKPATARLGPDAWRGWCRGTDVQLTLDTEAFVGGSALLLSAVLARFLALYTTVNSFVRLSAVGDAGLLRQWPAIAGRQVLA